AARQRRTTARKLRGARHAARAGSDRDASCGGSIDTPSSLRRRTESSREEPLPGGVLNKAMASPPLTHSSDSDPGYRRRRHGKGFGYYDSQGRRLTAAGIRARLSRLAIPPAWT